MTLLAALDDLIEELRAIGLPISASEKVDAASALAATDLTSRDAVRNGLAATLVKSSEHESAFETVFEIFFNTPPEPEQYLAELKQAMGTEPSDADTDSDGEEGGEEGDGEGDAPGTRDTAGDGKGGASYGIESFDDDMIRQLLVKTLGKDERDSLLLRQIAKIVVERHAGIQPGRAVAGTYYLYRAMRAVNPDNVLLQLMEKAEARDPSLGTDELTRNLLVEEYENRIAGFRQTVESEIRRRLVADRGADAVAKTLRKPLPEDVDFLTAASAQLDHMVQLLGPLARKLAARVVYNRRHGKRGAVDFRATMRESLSTGGIPLEVHFHAPRPAKPELVVLADISGSVSAFAAFTLQLTFALRSQFSKVRCFVFVDGLSEVTDLFERANNLVDVTTEINEKGLGVWYDGRSDYGNALETFWEEFGSELRTRTTVIVLGDARSNYHAPRVEALEKIAGRAGRVYWLNPEPEGAWGSGDSIIYDYARHCDELVECRNLRQLRNFVEQLD